MNLNDDSEDSKRKALLDAEEFLEENELAKENRPKCPTLVYKPGGPADFESGGIYNLTNEIQNIRLLADQIYGYVLEDRAYVSEEILAEIVPLLKEMGTEKSLTYADALQKHLKSRRRDETAVKQYRTLVETISKLVGVGGSQALTRESKITSMQLQNFMGEMYNSLKEFCTMDQVEKIMGRLKQAKDRMSV